MEYFLVLFCIRHRKKQIQNINQKLMEQRSSNDEEDKREPKKAHEILDRYSLMAAPIIFTFVILIYFFVSYKFDSLDPDVAYKAREKFKTICSGV